MSQPSRFMDPARRYAVLWSLRLLHDGVARLRSGVLYGYQELELQKVQATLLALLLQAEKNRP